MAFLVAALVGCALHQDLRGLVERSGRRVDLVELGGHRWRLELDAGSAPVAWLDGCTVDIAGPRAGRRVWVRDWQVLLAPDGSAPYVGVLLRHGSNLVVDDRGTGHLVLLQGDRAVLDPLVGRTVMVTGFVAGPELVQVVAVVPLDGG